MFQCILWVQSILHSLQCTQVHFKTFCKVEYTIEPWCRCWFYSNIVIFTFPLKFATLVSRKICFEFRSLSRQLLWMVRWMMVKTVTRVMGG